MKAQHSRAVAVEDSGSDPLLEPLRRLALGVAQGDPAARRTAIVAAPPGPARTALLGAFVRSIEEDGGRIVRATVSREGDPLKAAKVIAKNLSKSDRGGVAAMVRRSAEALETCEPWTVVLLEAADDASQEVARFWWALARRLSSPESISPALLIAVTRPSGPRTAWRSIEEELAAPLGVARIGAGEKSAEGLPATSLPRRGGRGDFLSIRDVLGRRAGGPHAHTARFSLVAAALAAMDGDALAAREHAEAAAECAREADDLGL